MRSLSLIGLLPFPVAYGWWDEGHMIAAAIAAKSLGKEERAVLEKIVGQWAPTEEMSDLISAASWADHLKCDKPNDSYCSRAKSVPGFKLFNNMHFVSLPDDIGARGEKCRDTSMYKYLPFPTTGAVEVLTTLEQGVNPLGGKAAAAAESDEVGDPSSFLALEEDAAGEMSPVQKQIDVFAWNVRLRLMMHIVGDLHNPAHAHEAWHPQFCPKTCQGNCTAVDNCNCSKCGDCGDRGANKLTFPKIVLEDGNTVNQMHALWDSCGGLFYRSYPTINSTIAEQQADKLMERFPASNYTARIKKPFDQVAQESNEIAAKDIHRKLMESWKTTEDSTVPFPTDKTITDEFMAHTQYLCQEQIAVAGYRIAHFLTRLVKNGRLLERASTLDDVGTGSHTDGAGSYSVLAPMVATLVILLPLLL